MKIEIGESLMLSYLKHVKECTFYQNNWKVSSNWNYSAETFDKVQYIYNKIIKHSEFSDIFKSELNQLIKQSEVDVIGFNSDNIIYTVDIAFHEAGLQYGSKIETKNRVFKKLLRTYLTVLTYFPNKKYELLFTSPKVNPATETIISEYFSILERDFNDENTTFKYISNDIFYKDILSPTISKSINDSDTNELFIRSIILNNLFEKERIKVLDGINPIINGAPTPKYLNTSDELILEFDPSDEKIFKQQLIETKRAKRIIFYKDKNPVSEIWNADKFIVSSNLRGNIHSNNVFRQWKELGIVRIKFEIIK
jgi:hypothetical protein